MQRRDALKFGVKATALALASGYVWSVAANTSTTTLLRPPAAKNEKDFLAACIRCGLCVNACPFDTLKLAEFGDGVAIGTPYFTPRKIPCYMCGAVPCVPACPTNALDASLINTDNKLDITKARMGVAVVDTANCIAYWGLRCDACYRACPMIDKALKIELKRNERTQKHAFMLPIVDNNVCTGCGVCEHACVTDKPAITIIERDRVLGIAGDNYVQGWVEGADVKNDGINKSLKFDSKKITNYLNDGEL
ncbi:ferredoxin-type protein NapG [Campylobacter majalis]|uniref:ferredoxin-type protein NapG n=1 Tax=Campylobacter majalis TaxID=2790656 RepID=UPI003D680CFB